MPKPTGEPVLSGWCGTSKHENCKQIFRPTDGVWEQRVCPCECHPPTTQKSIRRKAAKK